MGQLFMTHLSEGADAPTRPSAPDTSQSDNALQEFQFQVVTWNIDPQQSQSSTVENTVLCLDDFFAKTLVSTSLADSIWAVLKRSFISQGRKELLMPPLTHRLRGHSASLRVKIPIFCLCASLRWLTHLRVLLTHTFLWPPPFLPHEGGFIAWLICIHYIYIHIPCKSVDPKAAKNKLSWGEKGVVVRMRGSHLICCSSAVPQG